MGVNRRMAVAPAPMIVRATPVILVVLGAAWIGVGLLRLFSESGPRGVDGIVWAAWGAAHLLTAQGIRSRVRWGFALGAILGTLTLIASTFLILFTVILSLQVQAAIEWPTLAVYGLLIAASVAMLMTAAWGLRRPTGTAEGSGIP